MSMTASEAVELAEHDCVSKGRHKATGADAWWFADGSGLCVDGTKFWPCPAPEHTPNPETNGV
jgi:hypothetical protein